MHHLNALNAKTDVLGNLICTLKGNEKLPSVILFAHMDQLGFMVKKIEDSFIPHSVQRMEVDGKPDEINEVQEELINTVKKVSGDNWVVGSIERQKFYVEAKKTMAVITTSETRPYGCFIFTKGVLKPDGTVWII